MSRISRTLSVAVAMSVSFASLFQVAQAAPISTEQIAASQGVISDTAARASVLSTLERADVAAALQERGVNMDQARARIAALSDAEVAHVAEQLDKAPAGAGDIISTIVFIFVLLLLTDILGFTKIFPFTRSVR